MLRASTTNRQPSKARPKNVAADRAGQSADVVSCDSARAANKKRKGKVWLYRSLLDAPATIIRDAVLLQLFVYFLLRAAYIPRTFTISIGRSSKTVSINAGQLVTGVPKLSEFLRIPPRTIRAKLSVLAQRGIITYEPATHYSVVTVCNWETYQKQKQTNGDASAEVCGEANGEASGEANVRHTIKNTPNKGNSKPSRALRFEADDRAFAEEMLGKIRAVVPDFKAPNIDRWANDIRLAREQDQRTLTDLRERFTQANADPFWRGNILCPATLRAKFDQLTAKFRSGASGRISAGPGQQFQPGSELEPI